MSSKSDKLNKNGKREQDSDAEGSEADNSEPEVTKKVKKDEVEDDDDEPIIMYEEDDEDNEESSRKQKKKSQKEKKEKKDKKSKSSDKKENKKKEKKKSALEGDPDVEFLGEEIMFSLNNKKKVIVSRFKGQPLVSVREYYEKQGDLLPTKKGCSLSLDTWKNLKEFIPKIDKVLKDFR